MYLPFYVSMLNFKFFWSFIRKEINLIIFLLGPGFTAKKVSEMKTGATGFSDRKTSHKEIEEALAGGLNKVRLINILIYQ